MKAFILTNQISLYLHFWIEARSLLFFFKTVLFFRQQNLNLSYGVWKNLDIDLQFYFC